MGVTFDVVVPVYNGAQTIAACLESLLAQRYPGQRDIIVVENGSTDATAEVVARYPVRLIRNAVRGPAPARNRGIREGSADVIALTDADCVADPGWLSALATTYDDPAVGGAGGRIVSLVRGDRSVVERFSDQHAPLVNFVSGDHEFLPHLYTANASYRRSLLLQIGGFDERLVTADDVDVGWRLQLQTGARLAYVDEAVVEHRHRASLGGLARQYRQYGYGEVMIDALYAHHAGYPRSRAFQRNRMWQQARQLPRYAASGVYRAGKWLLGGLAPDEVVAPWLWLVIEGSSVRGKLDAWRATRGMRDPARGLSGDAGALIEKYFPSKPS